MRAAVKRHAHGLLAALVVGHFATVVVASVALFVWGEHTKPTFFLLYLPRHPFVGAGIVLVPLTLIARKRALVALEVASMLIALFALMELRVGVPARPSSKPLRLLTYNVFYANLGGPALAREIVGAGADVIVLQAAPPAYAAQLQGRLPPGWSVHVDDEFVLATYLRIRTVECPEPFQDGVRPGWIRYSLDGPSGPFQVIVVHPISARAGLLDGEDPRTATELRTRQIASAVAAASRAGEPVVIAGDTNLPPSSAVGRRHLSAFRDAFDEVGFGFGYTFPARLPWMRLDRVLAGARVRFLDVRVLPRGASDHRAVVTDFELLSP